MRFDVYKLPSGAAGYIVDVQSDFLSHLPTRLVIPLISAETYKTPIKHLHPVFQIAGKSFVLLTHETGSLPKKHLGKAVGGLHGEQERIVSALDFLLAGF